MCGQGDSTKSSLLHHSLSEPVIWDSQVESLFRSRLDDSSSMQNLMELQECMEKEDVSLSARMLEKCLRNILGQGNFRSRAKNGKGTNASTKRRRGRFLCNKWFDNECKTHKRMVNDAKKRLLVHACDTLIRDEYFQLKRIYKNLIISKKSSVQSNVHKLVLRSKSRKPNEFWKMVNRERNSATNTVLIEPEVIFSHFKLLHKEENATPFNFSSSNYHVPETDEEITFEETMHAIHSMKLNMSPGIDGIPSGVYRALNEQWISLLTNLFNDVLRSGQYPSCWSIELICPLYKSRPKTGPNNYRGITLLNCIGKILTAILGNRLFEWLNQISFSLRHSLAS